jgi:hypothetical protein
VIVDRWIDGYVGGRTAFPQLCTPRYAAVATAAQNQNSTFSTSSAMLTIGTLKLSRKVVGTRYSSDSMPKTATNMS